MHYFIKSGLNDKKELIFIVFYYITLKTYKIMLYIEYITNLFLSNDEKYLIMYQLIIFQIG